ncbi:MAG TPA: pyruvate kinase [candidate division Zixibacteria bacterium]|nr:pyruvate kinase [candidate division Zixibacteria bacterium]
MRRTKLVCTIGPASRDRVDELVAAGMDVARLNFSHGTDAEHRRAADAVRAAAERHDRPVAILADLPGAKIRLGDLPGGELTLATGSCLALGRDAAVTYPGLADDLEPGDRLMLADGLVELRVLETGRGLIEAEVVRGGLIRSGAGLNAPSERLALPAVTERDRRALAVVLEMGVDYVAQSFVRRAQDVAELRELLGASGPPIMAKIETRSAIENLPAILAEADAVMLARGDMGVEIPFEEVPLVQKRAIDQAVAAGVPVVVATQMLESMVSAPRPTRAEASDVANAVLDGADAVMLSAETAIGAHPVESARAAVAICRAAEADPSFAHRPALDDLPGDGPAAAIATAAVSLLRSRPDVTGIACFTRTGTTARLLARLRPGCPVTALSPDPAVVRRMALLRAIIPVLAEEPADTDAMIRLLDTTLRRAGLPERAQVVLVASIPFGVAPTNFLKVHTVGSEA